MARRRAPAAGPVFDTREVNRVFAHDPVLPERSAELPVLAGLPVLPDGLLVRQGSDSGPCGAVTRAARHFNPWIQSTPYGRPRTGPPRGIAAPDSPHYGAAHADIPDCGR